MALNASKIPSNSKFERPDPLEPGVYPARVVQIISTGLQPQPAYKGAEKPPAYELWVTYELADEFMVDKETGEELTDKPRWLAENFPLHSLDSDLAKSTKRYLALDPEQEHGGDWAKLANTPCMVTVVNNKSKKDPSIIYDNVASISTMRAKEASRAPELVNPAKVFDVDDPDMEIFGSLPQWLQDRIKDNLEYEGSTLESAVEALGEGSNGSDDPKPTKEKKAPKKRAQKVDEEADEEEDW